MIELHASNGLLNPVQLFSQFLPSQERSNPSYPARKSASVEQFHEARSALVVDDVTDVTEMLSVLLTHAGYDVSCASTAPEALMLAREQHFDVVISDIGMPEMNGYELAKALRSLPGYEGVPLVAVTGYSMFDDRSRSITAGFNAHVTKPIDPRAFLDLIEQL
ncbi:MAG: response regulator [Pyrinomonadaceae bacterium]